MKKLLILTSILTCCIALHSQEPLYDHIIFANSRMPGYYFFSSTSYQSPSWIKNLRQKLPVSADVFFTPGNALELQYVNGKDGNWKALVIEPKYRGQDHFRASEILHLKIFVQSERTQKDALPSIQVSQKDSIFSKALPLSNYLKSYVVKKWLNVAIPVKDFGDRQSINSIQFAQNSQDGKTHQLFIDQLEILPTKNRDLSPATLSIPAAKGYAKHVDISWKPITDSSVKYIKIYRSGDGGRSFHAVGIITPAISRYADFTGVTGQELPVPDSRSRVRQ